MASDSQVTAQTLSKDLSNSLNQMVPAEEVQLTNPAMDKILEERKAQVLSLYQQQVAESQRQIVPSITSSPNTNSGASAKEAPVQASVPNLEDMAQKDIWGYVSHIKKTPEFNMLTETNQKQALDYMYQNRVVPFFKARGEEPPARESLDGNDFATAFAKPSKATRFAEGTAQGVAKVIKAGGSFLAKWEEISNFPRSEEDKNKVKAVADKIREISSFPEKVTEDWFQTYKAEGLGEELAGLGGEFFGQLPVFGGVGKLLKVVPIMGQLSVGGAAVPTAVGKWIPPLRSVVASQVFQKSLFGLIEGAATAPLVGEDAKSWAEFGALTPVALKGVGVLAKPFANLFAMAGAKGVSSVVDAGEKLASVARKARPAPKSAEEAMQSLTADMFDKVASEQGSKTFAEASDKAKVKNEVVNHVLDWVKNPDPETIGELASEEHNVLTNVSPVAKAASSKVDELASKYNVPTTKEAAIAAAKKDTVRGTIQSKVVSKPVIETTPEIDQTLKSQLDAVANKEKPAMILDRDSLKKVGPVPDSVGVLNFKDGTTVLYKKNGSLNSDKIKTLKLKNRLNEILDYPASKEEVSKAVADGENPVVVQAKDAQTGVERETILSSSSSAIPTVEAAQKHFPDAEIKVGGIEDAAQVVKDRALANISQSYKHYSHLDTINIHLGKEPKIPQEFQQKLQANIQAALKAGVPQEEIDKHIQALEEQRSKIQAAQKEAYEATQAEAKASKTVKKAQKAKEVPSSTAAPVSGLSKEQQDILDAAKKLGVVGQPAQAAEAPSKAKAVLEKKSNATAILQYEKRDSDIDEVTYRRILNSHGYASSKDVAPDDVEKIRADMLRERFRRPFYRTQAEGVYSTDPGARADKTKSFDLEEYKLRPNGVFDTDTKFNPSFVGKVAKDFPDLLVGVKDIPGGTKDAQEVYQKLQQKLGADSTEEWLRNNGYDTLVQGRPGKAEDMLVSVLDKNIVKTNGQQKVELGTQVAKAVGVPKEITDKAEKVAKNAAQEIEDLKKIMNPNNVQVKKYDAQGRLIK